MLVLELCRESLAQQVRRAGPLPGPGRWPAIGIKIAGALETAHRHGFLHRDMKPQNILVTQFGEPALGDFGVAALQASAQATAGVFGFTTLHAAPEILEGHHLSPATDVYGLASTMYQLLTGLAPFATFDNEAPASVILRIIRDPVRPLRSEDIPIGLSDLLEAALAKTPDGRPPTAVGFAEALQQRRGLRGVAPHRVHGVGFGDAGGGERGRDRWSGRGGAVGAQPRSVPRPGPATSAAPSFNRPPRRSGWSTSRPSGARRSACRRNLRPPGRRTERGPPRRRPRPHPHRPPRPLRGR